MRTITLAVAAAFALAGPLAYAQSSPGGPGTPRPAADSGSSKSSRDTTGMAPNKSGSGTSTSGGSDANGDQGRDAMPDSNMSVKPLDEQHKPEK
jgi:hypothetical protein